jgi:Cu(I)/Ag(I) efflux system membrane fusion protein
MKIIFPFLKNILLFLFIIGSLFSCSPKKEVKKETVVYTCSMDPQIRSDKPGICPICKMELTKIEKPSGDMEDAQQIQLNATQMQLANIKTDTVISGMMAAEKTLTGETVEDNNTLEVIVSKTAGRIEKLYFKNTGETIKTGDKLYDQYSEDLLAAARDYLLAKGNKMALNDKDLNFQTIAQAAHNKLILYGLTETQINHLELKQLSGALPVYSNHSGTITALNVKEGDYVKEGDPVMQLADFSSLWIEAQLYAGEMKAEDNGKEVKIQMAAFPDRIIKGTVDFVNPELSANSKINLIRIKIDNKSGDYKPGMMAYISLTSNAKKTISIASDAVLKNAKSATVWIQKRTGVFEVRMVVIGIENKNRTEILSGLEPGEVVVSSGAYLLNSEYIFKKGADPMAGMKM